jgi:hypothetical protein
MKSHLLLSALGITVLFAGCTPEATTPGGSGGASASGSGGAPSGSGGAPSSSGGAPGSGGANASGGATPQTGGAPGTGGASTGSGGRPGSGGAGTGTGGAAAGGRSGGMTGTAGGAGTGGRGGSGSGSGGATTPGTCTKGQTKGSEVVILGESFYAFSGEYIRKRIEDNARKAGSLAANDQYRNLSVSGQNMNYIATTEWNNATQGGPVKWVIMDGGGIDCLGGGCSTCANTFKTLLGKMATANVQGVIYTRYPEPGAPPGSNTSLKACLDNVMPMMQPVCEGSTSPKCHWVDLRPVWVAGDTTDGLHPTQSGGNHVGDLIWSEMVKQCFAQ